MFGFVRSDFNPLVSCNRFASLKYETLSSGDTGIETKLTLSYQMVYEHKCIIEASGDSNLEPGGFLVWFGGFTFKDSGLLFHDCGIFDWCHKLCWKL